MNHKYTNIGFNFDRKFKEFKEDSRGFYSIVDGILAICLIIILLISFSSLTNLDTLDNYDDAISYYYDAEYILELMSTSDGVEDSILNQIYLNLREANSSKESFQTSKVIADSFFNQIGMDKNYRFMVNNRILSSKGNINQDNYNSASRFVGDYRFSLIVSN
ncbi:hypothetical protein [Methanobrevibacter boviskoreani]|uniref:hypothetical protein n=1 Tax=Methanobrevibacter boviskoreani TaxID=1348249 RepID=UPI0023F03D18|nr:hypothetical protein [Methanobrevibacter boviskoreani]MDD6256183.1 hypothetical protein [Methanobrevibacter boviskoreani]